MGDERFDRVAELFSRARELDPGRQEAFLGDACGDDAELRNEVATLLRHDRSPASILATGAVAGAGAAWGEKAPETIGPYRVIEVIGEGGMGIVYRAEQTHPIRRVVAIKLIRSALGTHPAVARFETERQVLALMHHPNIATVFDAGTTVDGRPYVVMEYVDGQPITTYCDRHSLGVPERLELFLKVCDAIQHAHRNAVVHRDIKPSNVLIAVESGRPEPKVIDFGIAKGLGGPRTGLGPSTEAGQILGTPEYMSPEQLSTGALVDTRTDVYALGLLLYEMLVGAHPFLAGNAERPQPDELHRRIREDDPARPSVRVATLAATAARGNTNREALARRLRGDLDWIVLRALDKDPARRYGSPAELADDIARHSRLDPVTARPPTVSYRIVRRLRKHRIAALLSALLATTGIAFVVTVAVQATRIAREAERAVREAAEATEVRDFLLSLFEHPPDYRGGRGPRIGPGVLESATDEIRAEFEDRPILEARLEHAVGTAHLDRGAPWTALPILRDAHESLIALLGEEDARTIAAQESLAGALRLLGEYAEAERLLVRVLGVRTRVLGAEHEDTYRAMAGLGALYKASDRFAEAAPILDQAAAGLARLLGRDLPEALVVRALWAGTVLELGRYEEVRDSLSAMVGRMERVLGPRHAETAIAIYNIGCASARLGDSAAALRNVRDAIERGFSFPGDLRQDPHLATLVAEPEFRDLRRMSRFNDSLTWADGVIRVDRYLEDGHLERAEEIVSEVLLGMERQGTRSSLVPVPALGRLARVYLLRGRYDDAERVLHERLRILTALHGDRSYVTETLRYLGQCELARGAPDRALEMAREGLLLSDFGETSDFWAYTDAMEQALAGNSAESLRLLRVAADRGYADARWLEHDLAFTRLRGDRRFRAIVAAVKRNGL